MLFVKLNNEIEPVASVEAIDVKISAVKLDIDNPIVRGIDVTIIDLISVNEI
jgi:hypothetical protein